MVLKKSFLVVLLMRTISLFSQALASDVESAEVLEGKAHKLLQEFYKQGKFRGTVLVAKEDEVLFEGSYGLSNIEARSPNRAVTKFRIASLTKQFTAAAILKLAEQGLVDLQKSIRTYLPNYPTPQGDSITLHHLLSHTSGLPDYTRDEAQRPFMSLRYKVEDLLRTFQDKPLIFVPGQQFTYCNSNYVVLGAILEQVTGITFETYIQKNILDPLGLNHTGYDLHEKIVSHRASGYTYNKDYELQNSPMMDVSVAYATGGLYSTVRDLWKWTKSYGSDRIMSAESWEKMFTPNFSDYGYGVTIKKMFNKKRIFHEGWTVGFRTDLSYFPEDKLTVVVLSNLDATPVEKIAEGLISLTYKHEVELPKPVVPISVTSTDLKKLEGTYFLLSGADQKVDISSEDDRLYVKVNGIGQWRFFPTTPSTFAHKSLDAEIGFQMENGEPSYLTVNIFGYKIPAFKNQPVAGP